MNTELRKRIASLLEISLGSIEETSDGFRVPVGAATAIEQRDVVRMIEGAGYTTDPIAMDDDGDWIVAHTN